MSATKFWLMKTEPDVFSYDDLLKKPKQTGSWDGVRNYQARNFMRDEFKKGQQVFIYHSSCEVPAVVGIATVVREAYPDPTALDPKSEYYDEAAVKRGENPWCMVDVQAAQKFAKPVTLAQIKETSALDDMLLVKRGMRLSIQPLTKKQWDLIVKMGS